MNDDTELSCKDKLALESQQQAKAAALVADMQHGVKLKPYFCKQCSLWHLATKYAD